MDISDLHALIEAVEKAAERFGTEIWWRGQSEDWPLLPGAYRLSLCVPEKQVQCEKDLTVRFLQGAKTRHSHWPEGDHSMQLAMMQHYRLPTRLLDWTESPLYALFFAVQGLNEELDKPAILWALSPSSLNKNEFGTGMLLSPHREDIQNLFKAPFGIPAEDIEKIAAIILRHADVRMTVQLSVFTIHGRQVALNECVGSDDYLIKFTIPFESKQLLRLQLIDFGIRESNLFPDLDHLANELKSMAEQGLIPGDIQKE